MIVGTKNREIGERRGKEEKGSGLRMTVANRENMSYIKKVEKNGIQMPPEILTTAPADDIIIEKQKKKDRQDQTRCRRRKRKHGNKK